MKGFTTIAIYFDPDQIKISGHQPDGSDLERNFDYQDAVIEEIFQWLTTFTPEKTRICLIEHESAELLADDLADSGFHVYQVSLHDLLSWFATLPPKAPDGSPAQALLRYLENEEPEEYESRTPQTEALMDMFDELDALEMVTDLDDEDLLPDDLSRVMKQKKLTATAAAQRLIPEVNEKIREHLMQYPELMTPELLQDFFPELIEALEKPRH